MSFNILIFYSILECFTVETKLSYKLTLFTKGKYKGCRPVKMGGKLSDTQLVYNV